MLKIPGARPAAVAVAVAAALGAHATGVRAAEFDPASPGVQAAYMAPLTFDKLSAAVNGLERLAGPLPLLPLPPSFSCLCFSASSPLPTLNVPAATMVDLSAPTATLAYSGVTGTGTIFLGANMLRLVQGASAFAGAITGTGGVSLFQSNLVLLGNNTYTGPTNPEAGTVALSGAGRLSPQTQVNLTSFGTSSRLDISAADGSREVGSVGGTDGTIELGANNLILGRNNSDSSFGGNIHGQGGLIKEGTGTLSLSGINSFASSLLINAGTVRAVTVSLSSNVVNNGKLVLLQNESVTTSTGPDRKLSVYSGNITGTGNLVKEGSDTIWLRGTNTYTGGTTLQSGILIGNTDSIQGNITNNAGLAFYQVSDGTYSGRIDGTGTIFIYGPGIVAFGGAATIQGNVLNGGRIARGDALGNLNIAGDLAFVPGSGFRVRVDSAGNGDRIVLSGSSARATLLGGTVDVQAAAGAYQAQTRYTILSAPGGVTGQFASATSNLAFLAPSLAYDPGTVFLTLTRNDITFQSVAHSPDQAAAGQVFTQFQTSAGSGDLALVLNTLTALSADEARAALDSIAAAGRAGLSQVIGFNQRAVNQNVIGRLGLAESGGSFAPATGLAPGGVKLAFEDSLRSDAGPVYAQASGEFASGAGGFDASLKHGFWLHGFGGSGRVDGDATNAGFSYRLGGIIAGYDHVFSDAVILGAFGSYSEPKLDQDNSVSHTQTKSYQAGLYGRYRADAAHVDGIVSYAQNPTDTSRAVTVGALSRTATASFNGSTLSAQVEAGYTFKGRVELTPLAGLQWTRQYQNDYTEQGAGALSLVVPSRTLQSVRSTLGARALYPFESAGATRMALEARAGWAHEFRDQGALSARLAGDPTGASFSVMGISIPRDSAVLGVGLAAEAKRNLRVYAELSAEANSVQRTYGIAAGLRYRW